MLTIGIIGVGYWGPNYARLCYEVEGVSLSWCCDVCKEALAKVSRLYPTVKTTDDYRELLEDSSLDAVVIVTPAQTHFGIAKDALLASKHVLLEKPLTAKVSEAKKLRELVKSSGKILMVDHVFKFNPAVEKLKQLVSNGKLGKIYYLSASYTALGPIRKDVDAMWDLAPHWVYVMNYLLGSAPISISAKGGRFLKEGMNDVVFLNLEFPGKILANIHISWLYPQKVRSIAIVGDRKMAILDDVSPHAKLLLYDKGAKYNSTDYDFADLQVIFRDGDIVIPEIGKKEPLKQGFEHFLECVKDGKKPMADVEDGVEVVTILEAADKSLHKGGVPVALRTQNN